MKIKITTNFVFGTLVLFLGWIYEIGYWLFLVFKIGNPNLKLNTEDTAFVVSIGLTSLIIAIGYTCFYIHALKEKIRES